MNWPSAPLRKFGFTAIFAGTVALGAGIAFGPTPRSELRIHGDFATAERQGDVEVLKQGEQTLLIQKQKISAELFSQLLASRLEIYAGLLNPAPDPYFGAGKKAMDCAQDLRPPDLDRRDKNGNRLHAIFLFATSGFVYGSCDENQDFLKSQLLWLYCASSSTMYEVKYFYPAQSAWQLEPIAECPSQSEIVSGR